MEQISYKLDVFEGPMDLLLHLISKHKLNINDIPIIELVNQYIDYVNQVKDTDFDSAGDFLEMAARLIYIKTVSLLPNKEEAEELKRELTGQLIEYRDCKIIAEKLKQQTNGFNRYVKKADESHIDYSYERFHTVDELLNAYINAIGKSQRKLPPPVDSFRDIVAREYVNVESKVESVFDYIKDIKSADFLNLFNNAQSKSELVAIFLAVLELAKTKKVFIDGSMNNAKVQIVNEG